MLEFAWPWVAAAIVLPILAARYLPRGKAMGTTALRVPFFQALQYNAREDLAKKRNEAERIAAQTFAAQPR